MNLDDACLRNKYTMHLSAVDISWTFGLPCFMDTSEPDLMVTPTRVINVISQLIGVEPYQLMERCRKHKISHPRQVAMMIIRDECPGLSLPAIARAFGMDHNTVFNGIRRARGYVAEGGEYEKLHQQARRILGVGDRP